MQTTRNYRYGTQSLTDLRPFDDTLTGSPLTLLVLVRRLRLAPEKRVAAINIAVDG